MHSAANRQNLTALLYCWIMESNSPRLRLKEGSEDSEERSHWIDW